jgi:putative DNA primase/helicase
MTNALHIAATLGGRRARRLPDGGYLTCCPVPSHGKGRGDRDPSLRVSDGDSQLLVYCYGGCDPPLILGELRRRGLLDGSERQTKNVEKKKPAADRGDRRTTATASYMWRQSQPIAGTIAETYLREVRGIRCVAPALRFLPAYKDYPPALIAAFGLTLDNVIAVHLTRLRRDGSGKIDDDDKMPSKSMVGPVSGQPIVLAELNDLLGLAICEGIEDALSVHQSTGLGVWAAGSASHMPGLADTVPDYIEALTIYAHPDQAGQVGANKLATALRQRTPHPGERPMEVQIEDGP